jgi:hypothetical protein
LSIRSRVARAGKSPARSEFALINLLFMMIEGH